MKTGWNHVALIHIAIDLLKLATRRDASDPAAPLC